MGRHLYKLAGETFLMLRKLDVGGGVRGLVIQKMTLISQTVHEIKKNKTNLTLDVKIK